MRRQISIKTVAWIAFVVAMSIVVSDGFVCLIRLLVPQSTLLANNEVAGNYLQTLGTVYAVLQAFVVFVVWNQFNEAHSAVESEGNEISDLAHTMSGFPEPMRGRVLAGIREYIRIVVDEEWALMAKGEASSRARRRLELVWQSLESFEPTTARLEHLYGEALARFNDLSDFRAHRLLSSRTRLPPTMWLLLFSGGLVTTGSMAFFGVASCASHLAMTSALAGLIGFVLYVICDLDNPFWGDWVVRPDPIARAVALTDEQQGKEEGR